MSSRFHSEECRNDRVALARWPEPNDGQAYHRSPVKCTTGGAPLLVIIEFGLWRMMWRGPRVDPERIVLEGVLIQSMVGLFIALVRW